MDEEKYKADFLWPNNEGSIEEAGYEFANAQTEEYRKQWWDILIDRVRRDTFPTRKAAK